MTKIFLLLLMLAAGVGLALLTGEDSGYLLLSWNGWRVEINNLLVAAALLLGFFLGLHWLVNTAAAMQRGRHRWGRWRARRRDRGRQGALRAGLLGLAEGRWASAEKKLLRSSTLSPTPLLAFLGAAHAAHAQGEPDRRDRHLAAAGRGRDNSVMAIGLQRARSLVDDGDIERAIRTLQQLLKSEPHHPVVLRQLHHLYLQSGQWQGLLELLPQLRRQKLVDQAQAAILSRQCHLELLKGADNLLDGWRHLPKKYAHDAEMVSLYLQVLIADGQPGRALGLLQRELSRKIDDSLLELFGNLDTENSASQLSQVEKWLQKRPTHPALLQAAGRIAQRAGLPERAVSYYEALVSHHADPVAHKELANLYIGQGQPELALKCLLRGLELAL